MEDDVGASLVSQRPGPLINRSDRVLSQTNLAIQLYQQTQN